MTFVLLHAGFISFINMRDHTPARSRLRRTLRSRASSRTACFYICAYSKFVALSHLPEKNARSSVRTSHQSTPHRTRDPRPAVREGPSGHAQTPHPTKSHTHCPRRYGGAATSRHTRPAAPCLRQRFAGRCAALTARPQVSDHTHILSHTLCHTHIHTHTHRCAALTARPQVSEQQIQYIP